MPRGVYDRSEMKKPKAEKAEKPAKVAKVSTAAKKGPGRPKGSGKKAKTSEAPVKQARLGAVHQDVGVASRGLANFYQVRENLAILSALGNTFPTLGESIQEEVKAHLAIFTDLRKQEWPDVTEEVTAEEEEVVATSTPNGVTAYSASVPMPPAPIPTITQ